MLAHCLALIDAAGPACVAVKPQLACFERLGFPGWLALEATVAHARAQGLLVIADAKRGDIASTAPPTRRPCSAGSRRRSGRRRASAPTPSRSTRCSAATRSRRSSTRAARDGAGLFVLVRTSNPGAADLFDAELAAGGPLWERIAGLVDEVGTPGRGIGPRGGRRGHRRDRAAAPRADARADAARTVPAARHRRAGRRASRTSRPRSARAAPPASSARRARSPTRTRRRAPSPPTPRAPRPSGCASRPGRSPEPARIRPDGGYHRCRWPDAAPRAFSRRSRWWPSRWPCSSSSRARPRTTRGRLARRTPGSRRRRPPRRPARRRSAGHRADLHGQDRRHAVGHRGEGRRPAATDPRAQPGSRPADADAGHGDQAALMRIRVASLIAALLAVLAFAPAAQAAAPDRRELSAPSAILIEASTGDVALRARGRQAPPDRLDDEADDRAAHDGAREAVRHGPGVELHRRADRVQAEPAARASSCRSPTCCAA